MERTRRTNERKEIVFQSSTQEGLIDFEEDGYRNRKSAKTWIEEEGGDQESSSNMQK